MTDAKIHEPVEWHAEWRVEKFHDAADYEQVLREGMAPDEVIAGEGNLLVYGGASALWHRLTGGVSVTAFDNSNAYVGVGDSATAAAATQTDLQASTNKLRKAMEATYPQHTDGTGAASNAEVVFRSSFATGEANFAWQEWAIFNASTAGRMLNRKVESFGTKSSGTWTLTITLTLA